MKIVQIVGTRPNFVKSAPLLKVLRKNSKHFDSILIHTGQHYDRNLSQLFFDDLKMPKPDIYLGVGSGSHAQQTGMIMIELEKVLMRLKPDLVIVFGDVNSTLAAALVASKLCLKLAHVEAGLRSFDNTMPEEINRIVTDRLSDILFVSEKAGQVNLENEGVQKEKVFLVGNIMIDSLVNNMETAQKSDVLNRLHLEPYKYIIATTHRPSNVDNGETLKVLINCFKDISNRLPVIFSCHPRTRQRIEEFGLLNGNENGQFRIVEPLGYLDFLKLQSKSKLVITDSGGIQEETTYLGIPCITLRENTELPATVDVGSNTICGTDPRKITSTVEQLLKGRYKKSGIPELWDGNTASRIVEVLKEELL
ncbi:MAG: UDP-N-acetylglucosamine 2-epimerase (non-hydrolyzing) [FCB group bacterium]|nr:UDP-N-acetylglucosamine 2-epimerase (non-hydrolyzing) [FCB group bacterium]